MELNNHDTVSGAMLKRRHLLRVATRGAAGLAGIVLSKIPPAYAAQRTLTMLTLSHFIEAADDTLQQMTQEFEEANRCQVKIDYITHKEAHLIVPKEHQTRQGHDIVFLLYNMPQLHHEALDTLDFMEDLGRKLGGWYALARDIGQVQGRWVAMPWYCSAQAMTYREDLYKRHGFPPPRTWDAWKETGKQIKETSGHKVGVTLNEDIDSNLTLYALLWSYGASTVDTDGHVRINAPETRRAMDYMKELFTCCMTDEVLSWDASGNNQAFLSGSYSWVHNPTSIYGSAKLRNNEIFEVTNHTLTPYGPGGQHGTATPHNYGVWQFAKEKDLAKVFLQYIMDLERLEYIFHVTSTFNMPLFQAMETFDWQRDPKTAVLKNFMKTVHMMGWPGPSDWRAEQAAQKFIVPKMFTFYVTGEKSLEDSVVWGEAALERIYKP